MPESPQPPPEEKKSSSEWWDELQKTYYADQEASPEELEALKDLVGKSFTKEGDPEKSLQILDVIDGADREGWEEKAEQYNLDDFGKKYPGTTSERYLAILEISGAGEHQIMGANHIEQALYSAGWRESRQAEEEK